MYPFWGCTSDFTSLDSLLLLTMNKTISVNPELFMLNSNRKSSKKRESKDTQEGEIQVKAPKKEKVKAMRKQHILRFLREKQEQNYKNLLAGEEIATKKATVNESQTVPSTNFQQSIQYFDDLSKRHQEKGGSNHHVQQHHNYTSKVYHENTRASPSLQGSVPQHLKSAETVVLSEPILKNTSKPTWGCLKNGNLPTFRDWKRTTQKVGDYSDGSGGGDKKYEMKAMMDAKERYLVKPRTWNKKQKKTVRRKYNVGRYSNMSKVAVLVSNKTIRNNILNKKQTIQRTPIDEMRKFLVKKGFIRVGTSAPNDVLMKMYETANLICGEVENHNADTLLYNYINDVNDVNEAIS